MPLPNSKVIPPRWEEHHRPVAEGAMTATGIVQRYSSAGVWNEAAGRTDYPEPTTIYGSPDPAPMRVQRQAQGEKPVVVGERQVIIRTYTVGFPADAPKLRIGDKIKIVTVTTDAQLPDQDLWIHDIYYGSFIWERDVVAQNAPPTQR